MPTFSFMYFTYSALAEFASLDSSSLVSTTISTVWLSIRRALPKNAAELSASVISNSVAISNIEVTSPEGDKIATVEHVEVTGRSEERRVGKEC